MDDLVSWFESHGGTFDTSALKFAPILGFGQGALALRDLPQGRVLFTLPRELTLSTRTSSLPARIGLEEWRRRELHAGWAGLILCMLWEESQGPISKWSVYLKSLPKTFDTPMFWTSAEIAELNGTSVVDKIGKDQAEKEFHEKIVPVVQSRPDLFPESHKAYFTVNNYHIMGSRILSRSFHVEKWDGSASDGSRMSQSVEQHEAMAVDHVIEDAAPQEEEETLLSDDGENSDNEEDPADVAMVPMADVLNAQHGSENAKLFYEQRDLRMCTTKPIGKGEQIWNTYGDPPNSDLLRRYGHVDTIPLPDGRYGNPADIVEVRADLVVSCTRAAHSLQTTCEERVDWWLEEGGDDVFILEATNKISEELLSFVRLLLQTPSEWAKTRQKNKQPKPKLDEDVIKILKLVLAKRLDEYATTLEADERMLADSPTDQLSLNKKHALVVRVGEKRILHDTLGKLGEGEKRPNSKKRKANDESGRQTQKK